MSRAAKTHLHITETRKEGAILLAATWGSLSLLLWCLFGVQARTSVHTVQLSGTSRQARQKACQKLNCMLQRLLRQQQLQCAASSTNWQAGKQGGRALTCML